MNTLEKKTKGLHCRDAKIKLKPRKLLERKL